MVTLTPMTRQLCHEFYKDFQNDPAIGHYYEFVYSPEWADRYFDANSVPDRRVFAIVANGKLVGECKLKDIDPENKECRMGIHLQNDSVKGRGYGTQAERLVLSYAFEELGMTVVYADVAQGNARSRHVLEKVGFRYTHEDESFKYYRCERLDQIRSAEAASHTEAYSNHTLFAPGSWLAKPVKTVLEAFPLFERYTQFTALDLGCGVGRNCIPTAQRFWDIPCRVDCVDILPMAIEKLRENARQYGLTDRIHGIVSSIDEFEITPDSYDLILAVSALEHVASREFFAKKLTEIRKGLRSGGVACLIVNSGVVEQDKLTGKEVPPHFEVNLPTEEMEKLLQEAFDGWQTVKHTVVSQKYDIPRQWGISALETDVVTYVVRRD